MLHESEKHHSLEDERLATLAPVLSEESYRNLQSERKGLKENAPSASGIGIDSPAYIPSTLAECKEKIRRLQERLGHFRQLCLLSELGERDIRRRYILLEKENKKLQEENERLRHDLKKAYNRIQEMLGLKKTSKGKEEEEEGGTDQSSSGKKRGAPKGHRGQTRPIPEIIDVTEIIPPPEKCPECHGTAIVPGMAYISKYVEDIAPIVKHTTEKQGDLYSLP